MESSIYFHNKKHPKGRTMKKRRIALYIFILLISLSLTGCSSKYGRLMSKKAVEKYVQEYLNENSINEEYELVDIIKDNTVRPKQETYLYRSKQRELEFTVTNTLKNEDLYFFQLPIYSPYIWIQYDEGIRNYYHDGIINILKESPYISPSSLEREWYGIIPNSFYFDIENYEQLSDVLDSAAQISKLCKEEQNYHTRAWLEMHRICELKINWAERDEKDPNSHTHYQANFPYIYITGYEDADGFKKKLITSYTQNMLNGLIPWDDKVPQSLIDSVHQETLDKTYINEQLMTNDMADINEFGYYNGFKDVFCAKFDYEFDSYMYILDVGVSPEKCNPHPFKVFVSAAGGTGGDQYDQGRLEWTIGEDNFVLETKMNKRFQSIEEVHVWKNDKELDLNINYRAGATYLVKVPVEDIAQMFDLSYEIDTDNSEIRFFSNSKDVIGR